jgi:DNA polymerase I-like protein with 3'-5' exonuclease and polymerase domains
MSTFSISENTIPKPNYEYITNSEDVGRTIDEVLKHGIIEVDTETTGLDPYNSKISLVQIGVPGKSYVYDVRHDTEHSSMHIDQLKPALLNPNSTKIIQNSVFDMKMLKVHAGYYPDNIHDTMLVEQLFNLGLTGRGAGLADLVKKYLGLEMTKEPAGTFQDYYQKFEPFQIEYAASDVSVLNIIKELQWDRVVAEGFENVCRLEFEFTKPMCEMELNGITVDADRWRAIMGFVEDERQEALAEVHQFLATTASKPSLFGIPSVNVDSNKQLLAALYEHGVDLPDTSEGTLKRYKDVPVIKALLTYRKVNKLISTYGETLLAKINPVTGRLHTSFRQMVSTGRMSSSNPNLQNIPKKQLFRSCFIAKPGHKLITADMSGAELRILGNLSEDPVFMECFQQGLDLHSRSASEVFKVAIEEVDKAMRNSCKALSFGLCYGMSKYGLAARLDISTKEAEKLIKDYFGVFKAVSDYLDNSARLGVKNGYTVTASGRKRFYNVPPFGHPDRNKIQKAVERKAKNAGIQGANADTVKEAMIYIVDRLEKSGLPGKLLSTVHDEVIVEVEDAYVDEVSKIVTNSLRDGFGRYFNKIPMESDALVGPSWLKDSCSECGCCEMTFIPDEKYLTKLVCSKCGHPQE